MRQLSIATTLLISLGLTMPALAQFNTDALKSMQKEGHKLVAETKGARPYKTPNGLCLDSAGGLSVESCDASVRSQQWVMTDKKQLMTSDGKCVAGGRLAACAEQPAQTWSQDGAGRLMNGGNVCLQVQGAQAKVGAKVTVAVCSKATTQIWR